jgi:hypothetical protein
MSQLSEHLSTDEYKCHHCGKLPPIMYDEGYLLTCYDYLFETFEMLRSAVGRPLGIMSGYRCPEHNAAVGGAPLSGHVFGTALDIKVKSKKEAEDLAVILGGLGREVRMGWKKYKTPCFHFDVNHMIWPRPSEFFRPGVTW